ncbi:thioredoxin family protein [Janthinobacterium agaricidamnosum]|uniref:Thioredoxin family protein n=1 Tax=Janthinobacterium agaricidamnosum NBRC 102515 = DSM 9628 TaxID=1349767 RepID=W0V094_9BURK|nr:thioredoxin family protein [Janthinobacterium agaricidamnosum]CDG82249.1 thioredoxin family protein [Janthinobacterium agaricidamnosum NBRC 102515 = DSM 9628]
MFSLTLDSDNREAIAAALAGQRWIVACLCAGWCGTCTTYRATFEQLAARHPDKVFVWIDIEDQADVVGDLDIENFPTLLIQQQDQVAFFGTVLPDAGLAQRMIQAQVALSAGELAAQSASSAERRAWQQSVNLRQLLAAAGQP